MKTISALEHDLILDARSEGLTSLPPAILEKDILITDVLNTINSLEEPLVDFVFCGGTSLSKGYRLIERMSEDIDYKLVVSDSMPKSQRGSFLSDLKYRVISVVEESGFAVPSADIIANDKNHYVSLNLQYQSRFSAVASLRPEIKLEFSARAPLLETQLTTIGTMLDDVIERQSKQTQIKCVSIEETLAEKVLSFLRRTAEERAGRGREAYDERLIRHVYDVCSIVSKHDQLSLPLEYFRQMVAADGNRFRNRHPEFHEDPVKEMESALKALHDDPMFDRYYERFVGDLMFGTKLSFEDARAVFSDCASRLIKSLG